MTYTMGHVVTPETREKIAAARRGPLHPLWKGGVGGYTGAHIAARAALADQPCAHADETCLGRMEVAFNHDTPDEFVEVDPKGRPFSRRIGDYRRLCHSHHNRYDNAIRQTATRE